MNDWLSANWQPLLAILGGGTVATVAWRTWIWPGLVGVFHAQQQVVRFAQAGSEILEAQLRQNGGESLIDKVDGLVALGVHRLEWQDKMTGEIREIRSLAQDAATAAAQTRMHLDKRMDLLEQGCPLLNEHMAVTVKAAEKE